MEVAVLIATYNGGKYISELFESLKAQTFKDFACYIHDDGSSDNTVETIKRYCECEDLTIRVLDYPQTGSAQANFLSMLKFVDEPYVMFCDQDDVWLNNKVEESLKRMKQIERDGEPALVFCDLRVVDEKLGTIAESFMTYSGLDTSRIKTNDLLMENIAPGCTIMANKPLYSRASKIRDYENVRMHDHWLMLAAACTGTISYIDVPLILYRQHNDNTLGAGKESKAFARAFTITKNIINRTYKKDYDNWLSTLRRQAKEAAEMEGISKESRELCMGFYNTGKQKKIKRVIFHVENKVLRDKYNVWFLIRC